MRNLVFPVLLFGILTFVVMIAHKMLWLDDYCAIQLAFIIGWVLGIWAAYILKSNLDKKDNPDDR